MESIALFGGGSLSKLPFYEPSSAIPLVASTSRLCFNFTKPFLIPQLISTTHGFTWNLNVRDNFLARCSGNEHTGKSHSNDIQDALKSLLSLTQPDEKNSSISASKNEALKMAVELGKYDEALCHMEHLFNGDADVAYEARLAHLQILIHLDEYNKALEFLEKGNFPQSKAFDSRLSLYKAVVHTMLGNNNLKKWWKTYLNIDNGNANGNSYNFLKSAKSQLKPLLSFKSLQVKTDHFDFNIIASKKMALMAVLNGDYGAAERQMKDLCNQEDVRNSKEVELEAKIAHIQILMHLDKYEDARNCLNEIENQFPPSDPRPFLYKAIGLTASGKHEKAKFFWRTFMETIGIFDPSED